MDKTGRNGLRVGDIELADFKERYRALADKHEAMIAFYNVDIQYNLEELEKEEFFEAIKEFAKTTIYRQRRILNKPKKAENLFY